MATAYSEFDTTQANLLADIRTVILSSGDWARPNAGSKPDCYKATTDRGVDMVIDLTDSAIALNCLNAAVWRSYDGSTFVDKSMRYLYWRNNVTSATSAMPLHVTVSAGKNHLFIAVEGPRAGEIQATSNNYGSIKNYIALCDMVPYHAADTTPCIFSAGQNLNTAAAGVAQSSHTGNLSRNLQNNASWAQAKLASLDFPTLVSTETVQFPRQSAADGKWYLAPYVVFSDDNGLRGRLRSFFFAGYNNSGDTPEIPTPPIGTKITYDGVLYKLINVNKGDGATTAWGAFGSAANSSAVGAFRSVVVAVPCT